MKRITLIGFLSIIILFSCNNDKQILTILNEYNISMEANGYNYGDEINIPQKVKEHSKKISINFGNKETSDLIINPIFFTLGENLVSFNITKKNREVRITEAIINV